jgi:membrane protein
MAIAPTLLCLFSIMSYMPFQGFDRAILNAIKLAIPNEKMYSGIEGMVTDFIAHRQNNVISISLLLTLYFASNGMVAVMRSFDRSITLFKKTRVLYKKRTPLQRRWTAIKLTLAHICILSTTLFLMLFQNNRVDQYLPNVIVVRVLSLVIMFFLVLIAISLIYKYGPSMSQRFSFFSVGSVSATVASLLASFVFFNIITGFIKYNEVYGSLGTLVAFMVWVWLNTVIILLGYELNIGMMVGKISGKKEIEHYK